MEVAVPTAADDVVATGLSGNLTIDGAAGTESLCRSADFTNYVGTLTQASNKVLNVGDASGGSFVLVAGMTYVPSTSSTINFISTTSGNTITPAGKTLSQLAFNGSGGAWSVSAALSCRSLTMTLGTATLTSTLATGTTLAVNGGTLNLGGNATIGSTITVAGGTLAGASFALSATGGTYSSGSCSLLGVTHTTTATYSGATATLGATGGSYTALAVSAGSLTTTGPLVLTSGVTVSVTGDLDATGQSISGGTGLTMSSTGLLKFGSFSGTAIVMSAGTTTATGNVTGTTINISSANTRTINMGSRTWTATATGTVFTASNVTGLTLNPQTSTIAITNTSSSTKTINGGGKTYNNLTISGAAGAGAVTITGANTWNVMTLDPDANVKFTSNTTQTVTSFIATGTSGHTISLVASSAATAGTLSVASGTVSCDYLSLQDSATTGGAAFYAGANSTNVSGNTGWIFATKPTSGQLFVTT